MERAVQQEVKRRTAKDRVFSSGGAPLRLVSAIRAEIDEEWTSYSKACFK